jgi:hypothetical protein
MKFFIRPFARVACFFGSPPKGMHRRPTSESSIQPFLGNQHSNTRTHSY